MIAKSTISSFTNLNKLRFKLSKGFKLDAKARDSGVKSIFSETCSMW